MTQPPPGSYPAPPPPSGGGYPPPGGAPGLQPSNYLALAIISALFCLPFGIVSIVKSTQVSNLWTTGQYAQAQASASSAKKWAIWGLVIGIGIYVIWGILAVVGALAGIDTSTTS
jgi:hypothetical protein